MNTESVRAHPEGACARGLPLFLNIAFLQMKLFVPLSERASGSPGNTAENKNTEPEADKSQRLSSISTFSDSAIFLYQNHQKQMSAGVLAHDEGIVSSGGSDTEP